MFWGAFSYQNLLRSLSLFDLIDEILVSVVYLMRLNSISMLCKSLHLHTPMEHCHFRLFKSMQYTCSDTDNNNLIKIQNNQNISK